VTRSRSVPLALQRFTSIQFANSPLGSNSAYWPETAARLFIGRVPNGTRCLLQKKVFSYQELIV
jgi:hypothetical protein